MTQHTEFQQQITRALLQLRLRSPFFATLSLFARVIPDEHIPTAATDGRDIFVNQRFWASLTPAQRLGLLVHEVLHAALLHVFRRGPREPLLWNIAADIVVNGIIVAEQGLDLPAGHLRDPQLEQLSVEEVYHILQTQPDRKWQLLVVDLLEARPLTQDEYTDLEQHWRYGMQHARDLAETMGQGTLPAGLRRELPNINPAQLDWRSYLWRFLVRTPVDFQEFDRRFIGQGLYLDALAGEHIQIYIAVDTSGSIGTRELSLFLSEVIGILSAYPHLSASLYYVDAACHGPYPLDPHAEIPPPVGGGGTDFRPFFAALDIEHMGQPSATALCVYLTDGYGTFPAEPPPLPVLWVLTPGSIPIDQVPFGEAVRLLPDA